MQLMRLWQYLALAASAALAVQVAHAQNTWVVDGDGRASAADCNAQTRTFTSIQAALDRAAPGDTVFVCPGSYGEQLLMRTDGVALRGSGASVTILKPAVAQANGTSMFGTQVRAIVLVTAKNVTITGITVDGSAADAGFLYFGDCRVLPFYSGIFLAGGSAAVTSNRITGIESAQACADGLRNENGSLALSSNLFDHYGRTGMSCAGIAANCMVVGNTFRGLGPVGDQVQSGVQIRGGATGAITGNTISDHYLVGAHGLPNASVGIALFYADSSVNAKLIRDNVFSGNQYDVQRQSSEAAF